MKPPFLCLSLSLSFYISCALCVCVSSFFLFLTGERGGRERDQHLVATRSLYAIESTFRGLERGERESRESEKEIKTKEKRDRDKQTDRGLSLSLSSSSLSLFSPICVLPHPAVVPLFVKKALQVACICTRHWIPHLSSSCHQSF